MISCPLPGGFAGQEVTLAHGGGGSLTAKLITDLMISRFGGPPDGEQHDGAVIPVRGGRIAFSTDCHVVDPLFFPGGDIGSLSIIGTANDIAMCGAVPRWISAGFILEEGFGLDILGRITQSMADAAEKCKAAVVTGDTKVVNKGKGDGVYICTSGVGDIIPGLDVRPGRVAVGDRVIVSGDLGRHGIAVLACREGISLELTVESDLAPLSGMVAELAGGGVEIHCLRDLTRGGFSAAVNEIASSCGKTIMVWQERVPIADEVAGACEILGLDPLQSACEGRFLLFTPQDHARDALRILGGNAAEVGVVVDYPRPGVHLQTTVGTARVLEMPSGLLLPRIC
jgi:hydrogenase expression/formation protein HypE